MIVPLYLGVLSGLGLALALCAISGHWGWFWMFAVVEAYALVAAVSVYRRGKRQRAKRAAER